MMCIHCNEPGAHPGTRKCTDLQACHGRQEYARGVADERARVPSIGQPHDCFEAARATPLTATPLGDALARAEEGVRYWTDLAQAEARDAATLRARVAELEAAANTAGADASAAALRAMARATKAEAERDGWRKEANRWPELLAQAVAERDRHDADGKALMQARAQVADWERRKNDRSGRPYTHEEWNLDPAEGRWNPTRVRPTVELLFAQVEAARTYARQALDYGEDCDATDLLAAMDEAKP